MSAIAWSATGLVTLVLAVLIDATGPQKMENLFPDMDKIVHFLTFGLMAYLCVNLLYEAELVDPLFLPLHGIIFVGIIGMIDELIQSHTPGRHADLQDVAADIAGAIVFMIFWYRVRKKREKALQYL